MQLQMRRSISPIANGRQRFPIEKNVPAMSQVKKKADMKVVLLGAAAVGKTTLLHRYVQGVFANNITTVGAAFTLKQWGSHTAALWDTAGEERFAGLRPVYCRGAAAAILAFDLTRAETFDCLRTNFVPLLKQAAEENCLVVVVGCKLDLLSDEPRHVTQDQGVTLALEVNTRDLQDTPYFETSSLSGHNVERVFEYIFKNSLLRSSFTQTNVVAKSDPVQADFSVQPTEQPATGCGCCQICQLQ